MSIIALRCPKHNRGENKKPFNMIQVAREADGKIAVRKLTDRDGDVVKGAWEQWSRPLPDGIYCQYCLNEGVRDPRDLDLEDLKDMGLGDMPMVFQMPGNFSAAQAVEDLREQFQNNIRYVKTLPAAKPSYGTGEVLDRLHADLRTAVSTNELPGADGHLYSFQEDAITAALDGKHVIVTTPTASGKSLTYILPILSRLLENKSSTALYISPLVALTADQMDAVSRFDGSKTDWDAKGERSSIYKFLRTLELGKSSLKIGIYNGDVPDGDRADIRRAQPQYLLVTPDMLHVGLLPNALDAKKWASFFAGLQFVVIDELHTYRGLLGAALANVLRRLQRICEHFGASPQFICASATLVDPKQTFSKLIGLEPVVIDGSKTAAPQQEREFILWADDAVLGEERALSTQGKNVLVNLMSHKIRTIAFGRSISEINDIYRFATVELREAGLGDVKMSPYMRELSRPQKRSIISGLKSGQLHGVIATSALEMGIDIGQLSAAVIIGFPGSIAQLWQQAGRAGRAGQGLIVLVADKNALDQFFVSHPDVLLDLSAEPVYCNPDNPYVARGHLLMAAKEMPLQLDELDRFGAQSINLVRALVADGLLTRNLTEGYYSPTEAGIDVESISFRNLGFSISVLTEDERKPVVEVDSVRAQRALHLFAHYQHIDTYYEVTKYRVDAEHQKGEILVRHLKHPDYVTSSVHEDTVSIENTLLRQALGDAQLGYGEVHCRSAVTGYYEVPIYARNAPFRFHGLGKAAPAPIEFSTQAWWLKLPFFRGTAQDEIEFGAGLYSLAGALRLATAVEELCDPSDIGTTHELVHPNLNAPAVFIYDTVPGGVGIAEASASRIDTIIGRAYSILADCPHCSKHPESRGCPRCVTARYGNESTINRQKAIEILTEIQAHLVSG